MPWRTSRESTLPKPAVNRNPPIVSAMMIAFRAGRDVDAGE